MYTVKRQRMRCQNHKATKRKWDYYEFSYVDYRGYEIYRCIECQILLAQEIKKYEEEMIIERKREELESLKRYQEALEKEKKFKQKIKDELWDCEVQRYLALGTKLTGLNRDKYKNIIPKEVLQLARATIKLQRAIDKKIEIHENQDHIYYRKKRWRKMYGKN